MDELRKANKHLFDALKPAKRKHGEDKQWMFHVATDSKLFVPIHGANRLSLQSYTQWRGFYQLQKLKYRTRLRQRTIYLQPLVYQYETIRSHTLLVNSQELLSLLADFCSAFFLGMNVIISGLVEVQQNDFTSRVHSRTNRLQFLATDILSSVERTRPRDAYCVAAITNADLYPSPEWNFVLGHASLTTGCGVFSFGREIDDNVVQSDWPKYVWRLFKVMTHEMCHMFGLQHCYYFECAMNESSSIAEAEQQPLFLCPVCLRKLHKVLKFDVVKRYRLLHDKISKVVSVIKLHEAQQKSGTDKMEESSSRQQPSLVSLSSTEVPLEHINSEITTNPSNTQEYKFNNSLQWLTHSVQSINTFTHT